MNGEKVTFTIGGREALPARAIPYVGDWKKVSPAWVARYLAERDLFTHGRKALTAYHIPDDMPAPMQPREWDAVVVTLEGYEAELKQRHSNDAIGYATWRQSAAEKLPPGAFVWLDEFEWIYRTHCQRNHLGDDELIIAPMLDEETRVMVHEGFGPRKLRAANKPQDEATKREHLIGWYDSTMNAAMWFKRVSVKPDEAAMLLCRIDPLERNWRGDAPDPERIYVDDDKSSPDRYRLLLRVFLDEAEKDPKPRTLLDWRDVAKREGLRYHQWIDEYLDAQKVGVGETAAKAGHGDMAAIAVQVKPLASDRPSIITTHRAVRAKQPNILDAVIEMAIAAAPKKCDGQSCWASFMRLAETSPRPPPLLGTDEAGVKYNDPERENGFSHITKRNFLRRFTRRPANHQ